MRPIHRRMGKGPSIPWYLKGGIPKANCIAAYQPKGAASYAASKVNLVNPGTYNLTDGANFPAWDTAIGWTFTRANSEYLTIGGGTGPLLKPTTMMVRFIKADSGTSRTFFASVNGNASYHMLITGANKITVNSQNTAAIGTSTSIYDDANAHVVAFTYSSAGVYAFYENGVIDGTNTNDQAITRDIEQIGASGAPGVECYGGVIESMVIYNIALTATQIVAVGSAMAAI